MYPEINSGIPVNNTLRVKTEALRIKLTAQPLPAAVSIQSPNINQIFFIWGEFPGSKTATTTTTVSNNPSTPTA